MLASFWCIGLNKCQVAEEFATNMATDGWGVWRGGGEGRRGCGGEGGRAGVRGGVGVWRWGGGVCDERV